MVSIKIMKKKNSSSNFNKNAPFPSNFKAEEQGFTYTYDSKGNKTKRYNPIN